MYKRYQLGVVAGKFYPFHSGHKLLIETALRRSRRVVVFVCYQPGESIPAPLRADWIRQTLPKAEVLLVDQERAGLLGQGNNSPNWARFAISLLGEAPDAVFSSEDYGDTWAHLMGAEHVCVDKARQTVPISGTAIREDPLANLQYLEPVVQEYFKSQAPQLAVT